jgi:molecular chaperone GrpE
MEECIVMSKDFNKKNDDMNMKKKNNNESAQENNLNEDSEKYNEKTENLEDKTGSTPETNNSEQLRVDSEIKALRELNENFEKEIAELKDKLLRKAAEFDNYKRRVENEQFNLLKYAAEGFIVKVLPIYDDLNRSLVHIKDDSNINVIKDGLQMVLVKFNKVLDEQGLKKIESVGQPFDFNLHEALMQKTVDDVPPHTVLDEIEPGYLYKDKVIRHSKVIVSDENSGKLLNEKS